MEAYTDYTWSDERAPRKEGLSPLGLGALAAAGAIGSYVGMSRFQNQATGGHSIQPFDLMSTHVKMLGNLSPYSILNTFRFSEFISPFVARRDIDPNLPAGVHAAWSKAQLSSHESYSLFKRISGLDDAGLAARGIYPQMVGASGSVADSVHWRPNRPDSVTGTLFSVVGGQERELAQDIMLQQATPHTGHVTTEATINKANQAYLQAIGLTEESGWDNERLLRGEKGELPKYLPINSPGGPINSLGDLNRRTAYLRSFHAMGLERMNVLAEDVGRQVPILGDLNRGMNSLLGFDMTVQQGSALSMYGRFGGKAAAIGGLALGVGQLDWMRRQGELPTHLLASGVVSGGVAMAAHRLGASNKIAGLAGLVSFGAQMALPGFDQGIGQGVVSTGASLSVARAAFSPFNIQRRALEGYFPGISDPETGALLGVGVAAAATMPFAFSGSGFKGQTIASKLLSHPSLGHSFFGLENDVMIDGISTLVRPMDSHRQRFYDRVRMANQTTIGPEMDAIAESVSPLWAKRARLFKLIRTSRQISRPDMAHELNKMWVETDEQIKTEAKSNPLNHALLKKLEGIQSRYAGGGFSEQARRFGETQFEMYKHAFFGADLAEENFRKAAEVFGAKPRLGTLGLLVGGTMLAHSLLTGSLLGSDKTAQQLQEEYSGKRLVEVKAGRFWESGSSKYSGDETSYFRPSLVALYLNRVEQKSLWGECLTPDSLIQTRNGLVPARDIQKDFFLLGHDGVEHRVLNKKERYVSENIYSFNTGLNLGYGVALTGNHPILVIKEYKKDYAVCFSREWERADTLFQTLNTASRSKRLSYRLFVPYWKPQKEIESLEIGNMLFNLSEEFGRLLGYFAAEGHTDLKGIYFSFHKKETAYHKDVVYLMKEFFKLDPHFVCSKSSNSIKIEFYSRKLSIIMNQIISGQTRGKYNKKLNNILLFASDNFHYGFLDGLIKGDGSLEENRKVAISFSVTPMAEQLSLIFSKLKLYASRVKTFSNKENIHDKIRYRLDNFSTWKLNQRISIKEYPINSIPYFKRNGTVLYFDDGFGLLVEKFSESFYSGVVLDFEVADTHSFLTAGFIVHNSEDKISPMGKWFRENFTYELERKHYYDRPYPITNSAFSNVPILGGLLSSTIGKLIKPPKLMRPDEWIRPSGEGFEFGEVYEGDAREPAYDLGALDKGVPITPSSGTYQYARNMEQLRELEGFLGFAQSSVKSMLTGSPHDYTNDPVLADSGQMTSPVRQFWQMQMGGALFSSEIARRYLMKDPSEVRKVNSLRNTMPSWLPARYSFGDKYAELEWGSARLPGEGFEAIHPELQGIDPEHYPDFYKYIVLSDLAPFSDEYQRTKTRLYQQRMQGQTTESQNRYIDYLDTLTARKTDPRAFAAVSENAYQLPGSSVTQGITGMFKRLVRKAVAPAEYIMLPPYTFRPFHKLMGDRDPIEDYEYARLYGSSTAFWDKPWRDFLRPAMYSAANMMGYEGKPLWKQEADNTNAYFDKLQFIKYMNLSEQATAMGDMKAAKKYEYMASGTKFGVNPQGSAMSIYWSLPDDERAYFNAFSYAQGNDRERIRDMVPSDQIHLYEAIWKKMDSGQEQSLYPNSGAQVDSQYMAAQMNELKGSGFTETIPKEDWIGYHESVNLGDIKTQYVSHLGRDLHDYGLWEKQLRGLEYQPYLEGAYEPIMSDPNLQSQMVSSDIGRMGSSRLRKAMTWANSMRGFDQDDIKLIVNDDRNFEINQRLRELYE